MLTDCGIDQAIYRLWEAGVGVGEASAGCARSLEGDEAWGEAFKGVDWDAIHLSAGVFGIKLQNLL